MTVVAVVAARNEAHIVGATVLALAAVPEVDRVLVVDDGSHDDTAQVAREAGVPVLRLGRNRGKGAAVAQADVIRLLGLALLFPLIKSVRQHQAMAH